MPLPGGASDKYGNRYEGKWTVYCLAQVMAEEADSIRLEPPDDEGTGCEFTIRRGETTEYHQVKRQHAVQRGWSIADLQRNGVLASAFAKTEATHSEFVFISSVSASILDELADAARKAESPDEFIAAFILMGACSVGPWSISTRA